MRTGEGMTPATDGEDWQCYRVIGKACNKAKGTRRPTSETMARSRWAVSAPVSRLGWQRGQTWAGDDATAAVFEGLGLMNRASPNNAWSVPVSPFDESGKVSSDEYRK
jgi:hypothetical protein